MGNKTFTAPPTAEPTTGPGQVRRCGKCQHNLADTYRNRSLWDILTGKPASFRCGADFGDPDFVYACDCKHTDHAEL